MCAYRLGANDWLVNIARWAANPNATLASTTMAAYALGAQLSGCLTASLAKVAATGAFSDIYLVTMPPIDAMPVVAAVLGNASSSVAPLVSAHNTMVIGGAVAQVQAGLAGVPKPPALHVLDITTTLRALVAAPPSYLSEVHKPCQVIGGETSLVPAANMTVLFRCKDPNTYAFYDTIHPTSIVHQKVRVGALVGM